MKHILVIDDDIDIGNMLAEALTAQGYTVSRAYSGTEALLVLGQHRPDLVLLDLMLPGLSGEALLPQLSGIPVIVVSAKAGLDSKVDLLLGGAADYVTKPFQIRELLARIAVQLRTQPAAENADTRSFAGISLRTDGCFVSVNGQDIRLTRTEFAIMKLLLQRPEQVITKSAILGQIAYDTPDCTETSLKMHISNLRRKLRAVTGKDHIEAVWGIGFRLITGDGKS